MKNEAAGLLDDMPIEQMVARLAIGIANAQQALDVAGIRAAEAMTKLETKFDGESVNLIELGFFPTFYQFVDTTLEVKISISVGHETEEEHGTSETNEETEADLSLLSASVSTSTRTTSVDARFASKYSFGAEASSLLSTRLVPVPPPAQLLELAHALAKKV